MGGGGQLPRTSLRVKPIFNTKTFFGPKFGLFFKYKMKNQDEKVLYFHFDPVESYVN